jgi:hypothetical protein
MSVMVVHPRSRPRTRLTWHLAIVSLGLPHERQDVLVRDRPVRKVAGMHTAEPDTPLRRATPADGGTTLVGVDAVRQVSVASGSKLVFVAGQVAWRPDGTTVGVGDSPLLGIDPPRAPGSLIGISAGFTPDPLVEVEAMAVLGSCPC